MKTIFLAQDVYSRVGGIQRFNVRFVAALEEIVIEEDNLTAEVFVRRDSVSNLPATNTPRLKVNAFSGSAIGFSVSAIKSALSSHCVVLGHINLLPLGLIMKIIKPSLRVYMIAHGIEVWGDASFRRYKWWEPKVLSYCISRVLSVSDYSAQRLRQCTNYSSDRLTIFPNVVDADGNWGNVRKSGVGTQILTVTRLGTSEAKKRVDVVIAAVGQLKKSGVDAILHVVGDGELRSSLVSLAESLNLKDCVVFHGRVSDEQLDILYKSADVFVLPSEKEGFGIVYLEAWKAGLPVVAAKATAIPEVIDDGVDGFLVSPVSPQTLSVALEKLLKDGDLRSLMVKNGRRKISEKFNHAAFVKRLKCALLAVN